MNRQEFLDLLSEALGAELPPKEVSQNVAYYGSYIAGEAAKGKSEEEVVSELGDPRMIAKSIIEAARAAREPYGRAHSSGGEYGSGAYQEQQYGDADGGEFEYHKNGKNYHISGRATAIIAAILILLILAFVLLIVGGIVRLFLPVLLPVAFILLGIYLLRQK